MNALAVQPAFVIHTGDVTHLSKATEFDDARAMLSTLRAPLITLPGEHDVIGAEGPKRFAASFGREGRNRPRLVLVGSRRDPLPRADQRRRGRDDGQLGDEQIAWMRERSRVAHA